MRWVQGRCLGREEAYFDLRIEKNSPGGWTEREGPRGEPVSWLFGEGRRRPLSQGSGKKRCI